MDDQALIEHIKNSIPDFIALYRFGSQAKGTARQESDIGFHPDKKSPRTLAAVNPQTRHAA